MAVTILGNKKLKVELLADESTKTQLDELNVKYDDLDSRVDTILTTPVESVSAEEIIDARQGEVTLGANITKVKSQLAQTEQQIERTENKLTTDLRVTQSNPTNYSGAIATFIDDDGGKYIEDIWLPIIAEKEIEMGFAIITGVMSGDVVPIPTPSDPISLTLLEELYADGHDVYSHSFSHPAFYEVGTTLETIDTECRLSQKWLNENGFNRTSDIIVYAGGLGQQNVDKKNVIRKYYKYGIDTFPDINPDVVDNWCIYRLNADTMTLIELKTKVDEAVEKNAWVVFMNHAYELNLDKTNQMNKIKDLIDYIRSKDMPIMKFSEGLKHKGNAIALGEYTENDNIFINVKGKDKRGKGIKITTGTGPSPLAKLINDYETSTLTIENITSIQDTYTGGGGVLHTLRTADTSYSYQTFKPINANELFMRRWATSNWNSWQKVNDVTINYIFSGADSPTMDDDITTFPIRTTTVKQIQWQQDTLLGNVGGGTLITYRQFDDFYSYQMYYHYATDRVYKRRWNKLSGVWFAWKKISAGDTVTTTQRNSMVANALTVGEQVFDSTIGKPVWVKSLLPTVWVDATGTVV